MPSREELPIPLRCRVARRFYEPVKVEEALVEAFRRSPEYSGRVLPETETGLAQGDEGAFLSLLCKLAHVFDIRKGGETVSGIAVVSEYDGVRYFIGSNARMASQTIALEEFAKGLFAVPAGIGPMGQLTETTQFLRMLKYIVVFNEPRIRFYTNRLRTKLDECLGILDAKQVGDMSSTWNFMFLPGN